MDCPGHFGHVDLALPIFHTGYFTHTYNLLQMICKTCSRVMLEDGKDETGAVLKNSDRKNSREYFRFRLDNPNISYQQKTRLKKEIMAIVKKVPKVCPYWLGSERKQFYVSPIFYDFYEFLRCFYEF